MEALQIKLTLLLLLFTGMVNAQIVNIPDANFKAKLLEADVTNQIAYGNGGYIKIDSNNNGDIEFSEVEVLDSLNVSSSDIDNLMGVSSFVNLKKLDCSFNILASLDVSNLSNLKILYCNANILSSLSLTGATNLSFLSCTYNELESIDLNGLINLYYFDCSHNLLTNLIVENKVNLVDLYCDSNDLITLELNNLQNLTNLSCNNNFLTNLNLDNLTNLITIDCSNNEMQNLDLSDLSSVELVSCYINLLTSIDTSQNQNLKWMNCSNNQISNLNVSQSSNLSLLSCENNQLTNLDVSNNVNLNNLSCKFNQIANLDLSQNINLNLLSCQNNLLNNLNLEQNSKLTILLCSNNQLLNLDTSSNVLLNTLNCSENQLLSLFIKNGKNESNLNFSNNPNLIYICVDETQVTSVQNQAGPNVVVNSYCSFTPGGNYNTITGNLKFDSDNNGCDANDLAQPNIRVNINDGANTGASFTNTTGDYKFYTQAGSFDITPEIENPTFFNFVPTTATIPFANNNNNTATQDFCISANGIHPDLEVVLAPITPARPGFDATYKLVYKNKGNQTLSGSVNLVFDDAKTDFISANPAVDNLAVNSLTWNYNTLLPFESRSIYVVLNVNSPLETPAVNIGDVLNFTATINPISGDELPDDNTFVYNQTVVGSYDPNDITCLEGNNVAPSEIGEYLHYVINFENTGNYPAENVVVKTIVDTTKFDVNSLQLLNTSNPVDARITGNVVEFIFENIQLGGPGGHGHILLKIKSKNTLVSGDAVAKNANIYFDYNAPVDTGMVTTVFQSLSNTVFEKDDSINVSPNPTNSKININCNNNVKKIELYDVQGRVLETQIGETKSFDISEKANGIYFLKITTEKGSKVEKVIKE